MINPLPMSKYIAEHFPFYGIRAGDLIGLLTSENFDAQTFIDALNHYGCRYFYFDREGESDDLIDIANRLGIKIVFLMTSDIPFNFRKLPVCFAYAKELTDPKRYALNAFQIIDSNKKIRPDQIDAIGANRIHAP